MAELILLCPRAGRASRDSLEVLRRAALRLEPEGGDAPPPLTLEGGGVEVAVAAPVPGGVVVEPADRGGADAGGVLLGAVTAAPPGWSQLSAAPPDGTYVMARWDATTLELRTDVCASRMLWYTLTDDAFLASTSQRAVVMLLGSLQLNDEAVAWLLSAGALGPKVSWDVRVRRVPPDGRVTLDRGGWRLALRHTAPVFAPAGGGRAADVTRLREAIDAVCASLDVDLDRWVLPLSGGCDSRVLLASFVKAGRRPRCVTWTTRGSLRDPLSDASIARRVARHFNVEHELFFIDRDVDLDVALSRFVATCEGTGEDLGGYVDGLRVWRDLRSQGVAGIVRGDEPLADRRGPEPEAFALPRNAGPRVCDYPAGHVLTKLGLAAQHVPEWLYRRPGEDLVSYQVRLCQTAWVPIQLASLHGPKTRFVEIANPLLTRAVVEAVRATAPGMLHHARSFLAIVAGVSRTIPTARSHSTPSTDELVHDPEVLDLVVRELTSSRIARVLPEDGPQHVLAAMAAAADGRPPLKGRVRAAAQYVSALLPIRLVAGLKPGWTALSLSPARLGFRALLASRTVALLEQDARALDVAPVP